MNSTDERVVVRGFPRIHFGLVDLGRATRRAFGGIGAAVSEPPTVVEALRRPAGIEIRGCDADRANAVANAVGPAINAGVFGVRLTVLDAPGRHVGLGSETTLRLACLVAASEVLGLNLSEYDIQRLSGRGGTSGIGIHTFFRGGLVVDAGHLSTRVQSLVPSSAATRESVPSLQSTAPMPELWKVRLVMPTPTPALISGADELSFYTTNTPIPSDSVLKALSHLYHGLLPAVHESDFDSFKLSLHDFQSVGFKHLEVARYGRTFSSILRALNGVNGVAAGMSSMGPMIFSIYEPDASLELDRVLKRLEVIEVADTSFRNAGFTLERS